MQDFIEREITVKAPKERVYTAISDPKEITTWFPNSVTGTFAVDQQATFDFGEDGTAEIYVVAAQPFEYFAFRWYTGNESIKSVLEAPHTLVEFHIEEVSAGTKVTVKESGFNSLPAEVAEKNFTGNTSGWKYMIGRLEEVMNQA